MPKAVMYCIQTEAASVGVRPGGAGRQLRAGTIACSAYTPYSPCRKVGSTQMRCPTENPAMPAPTASTMPAAS